MKNNLQQVKHCPHKLQAQRAVKVSHSALIEKLMKTATMDRDGMSPDIGYTGQVSSLKARETIPTIKLSDTVPSVS